MQIIFCFFFSSVIDQIIGCGERNGKKYFLVRFRGDRQNEFIDWDNAKQYSVDVMEYFGSRLVWNSIETIIDPENDDNLSNLDHDENNIDADRNQKEEPSTSSQKNQLPNEIEYDD